mmetsp:Transcript_27242/g.71754  ORF Transcript_27242/g.71754 Transcript_27242/m.71754 type:complete len:273 (-) Transcript_27242:938-1756(-)
MSMMEIGIGPRSRPSTARTFASGIQTTIVPRMSVEIASSRSPALSVRHEWSAFFLTVSLFFCTRFWMRRAETRIPLWSASCQASTRGGKQGARARAKRRRPHIAVSSTGSTSRSDRRREKTGEAPMPVRLDSSFLTSSVSCHGQELPRCASCVMTCTPWCGSCASKPSTRCLEDEHLRNHCQSWPVLGRHSASFPPWIPSACDLRGYARSSCACASGWTGGKKIPCGASCRSVTRTTVSRVGSCWSVSAASASIFRSRPSSALSAISSVRPA